MRPADLQRRLYHVPSADWTSVQLRRALRARGPGGAVERFESAVADHLGADVVAFGSARAALATVLTALTPGHGRVFVPAYTCVAVPNAVQTAGGHIHWVDVDPVNIDLRVIERLGSPGDVLIAQHTYGIPFDPQRLKALADAGIVVIEDRAHRFDADDLVGRCAILSLEHSKLVSGGQGGLVVTRDVDLARQLRMIQAQLPTPSSADVRRALWTSATQVAIARLDPRLGTLGSLARRAARRFPPIAHPSQTQDELLGGNVAVTSLHPACAWVALEGVRNLAPHLQHRRAICAIYRDRLPRLVPSWAAADLPLVRQPVLVGNAEAVERRLRLRGVDLGVRWFNAPVHPRGSHSDYPPGLAPRAEELVASVLSLPTHCMVSARTAGELADSVLRALE